MAQATTPASPLLNAPVGVTITCTDVNRSKAFYGETLGLPIEVDSDGNFMVNCGNNTQIYVYQRDEPPQATNTVAAFRVDNLQNTVENLRNNGVTFEEYDLPGLKTENGIAKSGDWSAAWFKDPDGNIIAVGTR